jgi:hypothetical protein
MMATRSASRFHKLNVLMSRARVGEASNFGTRVASVSPPLISLMVKSGVRDYGLAREVSASQRHASPHRSSVISGSYKC